MPVAIERNALYQTIDRLPENTLIELARFIEFGSLGIAVVSATYGGNFHVLAEKRTQIWGIPREFPKTLEFLQFKSQRNVQVNDDTATKGEPPFNPVYFPEGILQGYEFSPEFITDARKELWVGFGRGTK